MAIRKEKLMYQYFGIGDGKCQECRHLIRKYHNGKTYYKCSVYGDTASEATDWKKSEQACGCKNKPYSGDVPIVRFVASPKQTEEMDGQISFF